MTLTRRPSPCSALVTRHRGGGPRVRHHRRPAAQRRSGSLTMATARRPDRDPTRPVYVISVAATLVSAHPRTLRIYEDEGLVCPARTPTNIRLYSEEDIRRILWIRHLTRDRGVNLAGVRTLFELEERLGKRILEALYDEGTREQAAEAAAAEAAAKAGHRRRGYRPRRRFGAHVIANPTHLTPRIRTASPTQLPAPKETTDGQATVDPGRPSPQPDRRELRELPLVALRETVIFPEMIVPLQVGREKSVAALNAAVETGGPIALVTQRQAEQEDIARPVRALRGRHPRQDRPGRAAPGRHRPGDRPGPGPHPRPRLQPDRRRTSPRASRSSPTTTPEGVEIQALVRSVQAQIEQYVANGAPVPPEAAVAARNITEPGLLADMVAYSPDMSTEQRQELLETIDVEQRLKLVCAFLARQIEILELKGKIQSEVKSEMDKTQREYILREQLKAIQRELGEDDPQQAEINELREKVEAAGMPEEVRARAIKEIDRMSRIPSASPEVGVIRTYVDWLVSLPWNVSTDDRLDIREAAQILDEDHYGLEKIKERILEYLAVRTLADTIRSPILLFVGPPGVGKTSLGKSHRQGDGPQVHPHEPRRHPRRGGDPRPPAHLHRRAARPDHPEHQDRRARTTRCSCSTRSTRSAWTSGATRPRRCSRSSTRSRTSASRTTTSRCRSTCARCCSSPRPTCSIPIPAALRDRMEVIQLPGYTQQEKVEIARRFLVPKQMENHGLTAKHVEITDEVLTALVQAYTKEAGVRNLERELANIMRKVARARGRGPQAQDRRRPEEARGVPRPAALRVRRAGGRGPDRVRDGPRRDRGRRRRRRGRGHDDGGQGGLHPHRPAGRRDARVRSRGAVLDPVERRRARHRARAVREAHPAHPRPGRRHPQGRPVRGRDDGDGDGLRAHGHPRPQGRRDDRRDHAPRPGAADRRPQVEDPRRAPRGRRHGHPAQEEREGPAGHPRGDPQADQARPRRQHGPGAGGGAPAPPEAAEGRASDDRRGRRHAAQARAGVPRPAHDLPAGRPAAGRRSRASR